MPVNDSKEYTTYTYTRVRTSSSNPRKSVKVTLSGRCYYHRNRHAIMIVRIYNKRSIDECLIRVNNISKILCTDAQVLSKSKTVLCLQIECYHWCKHEKQSSFYFISSNVDCYKISTSLWKGIYLEWCAMCLPSLFMKWGVMAYFQVVSSHNFSCVFTKMRIQTCQFNID